jgi:hypothetical protein
LGGRVGGKPACNPFPPPCLHQNRREKGLDCRCPPSGAMLLQGMHISLQTHRTGQPGCPPLQARFGARSGAAPAFLGLCKMVLGLAFGSSLLALLQAFPRPLLGALGGPAVHAVPC